MSERLHSQSKRTLVRTEDGVFARDSVSGAVINTDTKGLQLYKHARQREKALQQLFKTVEMLQQRVAYLESRQTETDEN